MEIKNNYFFFYYLSFLREKVIIYGLGIYYYFTIVNTGELIGEI